MKSKATFIAVILLVSGCSAYEMPALNSDHPASLAGYVGSATSMHQKHLHILARTCRPSHLRQPRPAIKVTIPLASRADKRPPSGEGKVIAIGTKPQSDRRRAR